MSRMIGVNQFFVNGGYIYIVDDYGQIWSYHVPNGDWNVITKLPKVNV